MSCPSPTVSIWTAADSDEKHGKTSVFTKPAALALPEREMDAGVSPRHRRFDVSQPIAVDLFCGLGGWTEGLLAEGYFVVGFDIERHEYGDEKYPANLVLQNVLTIHGRQFKSADLIVASPPCQAYSYRAMPWKKAKALPPPCNALFDACFRIQREACEAAGRFIPMVVENVRGAQKWVGRSRWNFGSFHLWGDVPALMPHGKHKKQTGDPSWFYDNYENSARRFSSKSKERKQWSAMIAKIPFALSRHIAAAWKPRAEAA